MKQILLALDQHPSTEQQFFDAMNHHRTTLRNTIHHYMEKNHADVILYPTVAIMPPLVSDIHGPEWVIDHKGQNVSQFLITAKNTDVAAAANLPAITLPSEARSDKDHLPIGIELASLTGYDRRLIASARALEKLILGQPMI